MAIAFLTKILLQVRGAITKSSEEEVTVFPIYVVIVDSNPRFLEIATRFLQKREGVLVYSAVSTSNEILRQTNIFEPDIVFYNLDESDPNGLDTIRKLRSKFPEITIIFNESETHRRTARAVRSFLKHYLNIDLKLDERKWEEFTETREQPTTPHMYRESWCARGAIAEGRGRTVHADPPRVRAGV